MLNKIIIISALLIFATGCHKNKKDEVLPDANTTLPPATQDTNVQSKDINFDSQGSDSGNISGLYTLHFDYDRSTLTQASRSLAQKDADWVKAHSGTTVQIEGHCDQHGSIEYNLALGERRAKAAKTYLLNLGVNASNLTTISYGKERPLDSSGSAEADAKNRRANFVAQGK
jgi:peptidoglycan-associated lipoprotein